jgi:hypothetical protein
MHSRSTIAPGARTQRQRRNTARRSAPPPAATTPSPMIVARRMRARRGRRHRHPTGYLRRSQGDCREPFRCAIAAGVFVPDDLGGPELVACCRARGRGSGVRERLRTRRRRCRPSRRRVERCDRHERRLHSAVEGRRRRGRRNGAACSKAPPPALFAGAGTPYSRCGIASVFWELANAGTPLSSLALCERVMHTGGSYHGLAGAPGVPFFP